jgi:excisionase family DNA binding protein
MDPMTIMSVAEVADYLRVSERTVTRLIAKGNIPCFNVAGEPRFRYGDLVQWFQADISARSLENLRQQIQKPSTWRKALEAHPDFRARVLAENYREGTFGSFLKEAALSEEDPPSDGDEDDSGQPRSSITGPPDRAPDAASSTVGSPEEYLRRLCRKRLVAALVTIGLVVVALGSFTDALKKILELLVGLFRLFL